ncbi:VWA domain-containing protein [Aestuariibius insulae]|uniref:VWA domain-containing protein n=1 Tax=Aestuariibius insulae TaxID=2058287 RepID=UPI00345E1C0B
MIIPNAERIRPGLAGRVAQYIDTGAQQPVFAMDESLDEGGMLPTALSDRLAFKIDLTGVQASAFHVPVIAPGSNCLPPLIDDLANCVAETCSTLGILNPRSGLQAVQTARMHAALFSRNIVTDEDLLVAVRLVLAHRATRVPEPTQENPPQESENSEPSSDNTSTSIPEDLLLDAVASSLPAGLLEQLKSRTARAAKGSGSGARQKGNRRGRPLPSRPGRLSGARSIDIPATLRAAAPWQKMRGQGERVRIFPSDIRLKRYESLSDRLLIFVVDASGSAAISRLGEAKGAVELLLSQAYARRDHVSLIAFRADDAETLLPPTRSLVRTKRKLADLPGGGGTPLASGLRDALGLALRSRQQGMTPTVVLLTDGRPNIRLDGTADRVGASRDAQTLASQIKAHQIEAIVIDTGKRASRSLEELSTSMNAIYLPMPRADASRLSEAVTSTTSV